MQMKVTEKDLQAGLDMKNILDLLVASARAQQTKEKGVNFNSVPPRPQIQQGIRPSAPRCHPLGT